MNTRLARNVLIALLALSIASCTSADSDLTGVDVDTVTGTISVGVTSPGSSDFEIAVFLNGPAGFPPRTAPLRLGDTLTFDDLEPGTYTVGTTIFGFDCQSVSASVRGNQTTRADIACTRRAAAATGVVTGIVMSGDSPLGGASVELSAPGVSYTRTSGANGNISFVGVQAGEYTLSASHQHFTCSVQTIHVDPAQRANANISCTPKPTGEITGTVFSNDLETTIVHLTGPASRTATPVGSLNGAHFTFDDLPPGTYRITATASGMTCSEVSAAVQVGRTTAVEIHCSDNPPVGGDLINNLGNWGYIRLNPSQTGICPSPLPDAGSGSIVRGSTNTTFKIIGLDPEIEIVGLYDGGSGGFTGSGTTVRGDGSTLQSDVTGSFYWDVWDVGGFWFSTYSAWTRRHRDPSGNLVCTEVYEAHGYPVGS